MVSISSYLLLQFLEKYFFILKAAADGWIVQYIGGNQFTFSKLFNKKNAWSTADFLSKYRYNLNC